MGVVAAVLVMGAVGAACASEDWLSGVTTEMFKVWLVDADCLRDTFSSPSLDCFFICRSVSF